MKKAEIEAFISQWAEGEYYALDGKLGLHTSFTGRMRGGIDVKLSFSVASRLVMCVPVNDHSEASSFLSAVEALVNPTVLSYKAAIRLDAAVEHFKRWLDNKEDTPFPNEEEES